MFQGFDGSGDAEMEKCFQDQNMSSPCYPTMCVTLQSITLLSGV